jgi:hypothetical protein
MGRSKGPRRSRGFNVQVQRNVVVRYQSRSASTRKELVESVGHLSLVTASCKYGREIGTRDARVRKLILIDLNGTGLVVHLVGSYAPSRLRSPPRPLR